MSRLTATGRHCQPQQQPQFGAKSLYFLRLSLLADAHRPDKNPHMQNNTPNTRTERHGLCNLAAPAAAVLCRVHELERMTESPILLEHDRCHLSRVPRMCAGYVLNHGFLLLSAQGPAKSRHKDNHTPSIHPKNACPLQLKCCHRCRCCAILCRADQKN